MVDHQSMTGFALRQQIDRMHVRSGDPGGSVELLSRCRDGGGDYAVALAVEEIDAVAREPGERVDTVLAGKCAPLSRPSRHGG